MLESIKLFLGIDDSLQDKLLNAIIDETKQRILSYLNLKRAVNFSEVPSELDYVVRDVCVKRFNKRNSEGATADSEEGRSYTWESSYLKEYADLLETYWDDDQRFGGGTGRARFV